MNTIRSFVLVSVLALAGCQGFKKTVGLCTCNDAPEACCKDAKPAEAGAVVEADAATTPEKLPVNPAIPVMFFLTLVGGTGYIAYKIFKDKKAK